MRRRTAAVFLACVALSAGYAVFLVEITAFSVGGSDSSGYMNTARRMVQGTLVARPRTLDRLGLSDDFALVFIPLGFVEGPRPGTMAPFYPPGYPAHLAAAGAAFGWERSPYLVTVIAALLCLLLFYALARELALPPSWSLAGTAVLAAWPVFIGQAVQPMSDVPATLWSMLSIYAALRARRRGAAWAALAGAAFGVAVLVRPTNAFLLLPLSFALPWKARDLLAFAAGGSPFAVALIAYNRYCFASPFQSGYGKTRLLDAVAISNFPARVRHYSGWIFRTLTPIVPLAWLGLVAPSRTSRRVRALLLTWFGVFFLFHCFYEPYDSFYFVRFLLPGAAALLLGALITLRGIVERIVANRPAAAVALLLAAIVLTVEIRSMNSTNVLHIAEGESIYPRICRWVEVSLPRDAVVLSMAASGALEYYTRMSYANWAWLSPERFAEVTRQTQQRRVQWFALLFPFEWERLPDHAPGDWRKIGTMRDVGLYRLGPSTQSVAPR